MDRPPQRNPLLSCGRYPPVFPPRGRGSILGPLMLAELCRLVLSRVTKREVSMEGGLEGEGPSG